MPNALIFSISSDIGFALAERLASKQWSIQGTYRTETARLTELRSLGIALHPVDAKEAKACHGLAEQLTSFQWDALIICHGTLDPIGPFETTSIDEWQEGLDVNFTSVIRIIHEFLPSRNRQASTPPMVLLFAGGGTNSAPPNFSAYTVGKIALIKMCELLQAEISDARFTILGPGWVNTKIHEQTLQAEAKAPEAYKKTKAMLGGTDNWVSMSQVLDCCEWALPAPKEGVGGRNFSVAHDAWAHEDLLKRLVSDSEMYKLRRSSNSSL